MRILVIGGTRFVGRHLVEAALAQGHDVTLFNRGMTNPDLFPDIETIHGDREKDIHRLDSHHWDGVIDVAGYVPRIVRLSAQALKDTVSRYGFISTISVYENFEKIGLNESDPVAQLQDETKEEVTGESYGPLKARCEQVVQDLYGERALIIRPGLVVGPYDPTDRFTYWPVRVARGGMVLAPDRPEAPIQIIDARDLAEFTIRLITSDASGIYNVTGPAQGLTIGRLLEVCKEVAGSDASFQWASREFLRQHNVEPWSDLPAWVPDDGESAGFARLDVSKAIGAGLTFRPLEETVRDTLTWAITRPTDHAWRAGLTADREQDLLAALKGESDAHQRTSSAA